MPESAEAYAERVSLSPLITELLNSCCSDQPDKLQPYLLATLCSKYPAMAKGVTIDDPKAKEWKTIETKVIDPLGLETYLNDLRWSPTLNAIMEQVFIKRPEKPITFMISLIVNGELEADDGAEQDAAAAKMQALHRGRAARKARAEQKKKKEEEELAQAATNIQKTRRGYKERQKAKEAKLEAERKEAEAKEAEAKQAAEAKESADQAAAATKMQAIQRGKNARRAKTADGSAAEAPSEEPVDAPVADAAEDIAAEAGSDPAQDAAAARMQAIQRGKKARDEYLAARKEKTEQEAAATKMQALQRGKNARKQQKASAAAE